MIGEAEQMGADAVVNVRFATSAIIQGAAEVIAYASGQVHTLRYNWRLAGVREYVP